MGRSGKAPAHGAGLKKVRLSGRKQDAAPQWRKPQPIELATNISIDDALGAIVTACRDHWRINLPAAVAARDPEGIHQVRVGLRRFRTALALFRDYIPQTQLAWLKAEAKVLGELLGPARDLDVFLHDHVQPVASAAAHDTSVAALLRSVRGARASAHGRAVQALTGKRYARFMNRLETWISGRGWRNGRGADDGSEPASVFARRVLNRRLGKIRARTKAVEEASMEDLHELRIAIKKVRYGFEFFHSLLPPKRAARTARLLKTLQDSLGHLNDLEVAKRTIAELTAKAGTPDTRTAIAAGGNRLALKFRPLTRAATPEAARIAARVRAQKPL
jgi:triphosphatase